MGIWVVWLVACKVPRVEASMGTVPSALGKQQSSHNYMSSEVGAQFRKSCCIQDVIGCSYGCLDRIELQLVT